MKRLAVLCALALGLSSADVRADWPCSSCGRHQPRGHMSAAHAGGPCPSCGVHEPWWNMIAARDKSRCRDQARLQRFWHDYYSSMSAYCAVLENVDWAAYYRYYGSPMGSVPGRCGGPSSVQMGPVFAPPPPLWSPPHVPWGHTPCCSPDVPCATCH